MRERPLLEVEHLEVRLPVRGGAFGRPAGYVSAVDDVTLSIFQGETLGIVGESGCGKTTLIRSLVRLNEPTAGAIRFQGVDITAAPPRRLRALRREVQMVFQDPQSSLNPRKRVGDIVGAAAKLRGHGRQEVADLLDRLGLSRADVHRYPHEFSGGQRQRIGIARALAAGPRLVVLDEPVSALDVSIQAQILNLLGDLQEELGLSYVFVAHDLQVVRQVSHRIAVMYLGKVVELAPAEDLHTRPMHPYTRALIDAVPVPDPSRRRERRRLQGEPASAIDPPPGCRFHPRCPRASDRCRALEPPLASLGPSHLVACHHPLDASPDELKSATRSDQSPLTSSRELSPTYELRT